jgi:hypothetical protein
VIYAALKREKQIKKWNREWKMDLIFKINPEWRDCIMSLVGQMICLIVMRYTKANTETWISAFAEMTKMVSFFPCSATLFK